MSVLESTFTEYAPDAQRNLKLIAYLISSGHTIPVAGLGSGSAE